MAIAIHEEITYTDTPGDTWDVLQTTSPNTTAGTFQFQFFLNALVAGEVFEAKLRVKDGASGTVRDRALFSVIGVQSNQMWESKGFALSTGWDVLARQRTGTGRAVKVLIVKVT